jgi:hypothetical protein
MRKLRKTEPRQPLTLRAQGERAATETLATCLESVAVIVRLNVVLARAKALRDQPITPETKAEAEALTAELEALTRQMDALGDKAEQGGREVARITAKYEAVH